MLMVVALAAANVAAAPTSSPVGLWETIDDDGKKVTGVVEISADAEGKLSGRLRYVVDPPADGKCKKCPGELKNKPLIGMRIMWDLEPQGDGEWDDGEIMDPDNGKVYDCKLALLDGGKRLRVRGYLGISLFGRSQVWRRVTIEPKAKSATSKPKPGNSQR